jgi:hypothetical protein
MIKKFCNDTEWLPISKKCSQVPCESTSTQSPVKGAVRTHDFTVFAGAGMQPLRTTSRSKARTARCPASLGGGQPCAAPSHRRRRRLPGAGRGGEEESARGIQIWSCEGWGFDFLFEGTSADLLNFGLRVLVERGYAGVSQFFFFSRRQMLWNL